MAELHPAAPGVVVDGRGLGPPRAGQGCRLAGLAPDALAGDVRGGRHAARRPGAASRTEHGDGDPAGRAQAASSARARSIARSAGPTSRATLVAPTAPPPAATTWRLRPGRSVAVRTAARRGRGGLDPARDRRVRSRPTPRRPAGRPDPLLVGRAAVFHVDVDSGRSTVTSDPGSCLRPSPHRWGVAPRPPWPAVRGSPGSGAIPLRRAAGRPEMTTVDQGGVQRPRSPSRVVSTTRVRVTATGIWDRSHWYTSRSRVAARFVAVNRRRSTQSARHRSGPGSTPAPAASGSRIRLRSARSSDQSR
jgi:hypothetical protein